MARASGATRAPAIHTKNKMWCPVCDHKMVKAMTDPGPYWEQDIVGTMIEVAHVYYGCVNEECNTMVRLRYRKDGQTGDLFRMVRARQAGDGPEIITQMPGNLSDVVDL